MNDIYQWVQFNRAIINARDEPLADYRKYRRLHLLIGDSNMSPLCHGVKNRDNCVCFIVARGWPVAAKSRAGRCRAKHPRHIPRSNSAMDCSILRTARPSARSTCSGNFTIWRKSICAIAARKPTGCWKTGDSFSKQLQHNHQALIGGVDWITKKWLLEAFVESEGLSWDDPWLQSVDLEYHNIDPLRGLFFAVTPGKRIAEWNNNVRRSSATHVPPANTRASGRARAVAFFQDCDSPYVINWDSIACDNRDFLVMGDPFQTYNEEVERFLAKPRTADVAVDSVDR